MSIKENIKYGLSSSRKMLDGLIESMSTREDWLHQVHPKANHPLWVVGHLGMADNMFIKSCLLYTSPSPRDLSTSRMPSSA